MYFEDLPTTPRSEELVDKAFSRAARAGRGKQGVEAQTSMLQTAANILSDNLQNITTTWPDFDAIDLFYYELAEATLAETDVGGIDSLRRHLADVMWAGRQTAEIKAEYQGRIRNTDSQTARKLRKQAFARLADITEEVAADLRAINDARNALNALPDIRADVPTIVVAGYPNVGKTAFVNHVTNAQNETASYPFTTTQLNVGHVDHNHIRYQLVDTPGLLDRPADERNAIEAQAVAALTHLADTVVVVLDATEECGYPLDRQLDLLADIKSQFSVPVLTVCNKADRETDHDLDIDVDSSMSVKSGVNVDTVLEMAIEAVSYEPELPPER